MEEDISGSGRHIDAGEANRLAQDLNRQVTPDIPAYVPQETAVHGSAGRQEAPSDVERDPPDRDLEESTFPPHIGGDTAIGGSSDERRVLRLEEER